MDSLKERAKALMSQSTQQKLLQLMNDIIKFPKSYPFHHGLNSAKIPEMAKIIDRDVSMSEIERNAKANMYASARAAIDDIMLVRR